MGANATYMSNRTKRLNRASTAEEYFNHIGFEPGPRYLRMDSYGWDRMYSMMMDGLFGKIEKEDGCVTLYPENGTEPFIFEEVN